MAGWIEARTLTARRPARRSAERRRTRVWESVRHAQAQGLARRIQSAAELRTRQRAKSKVSKQKSKYQKYWILVVRREKILNLSGPERESIEF